jgi:phosphoribosylformylglycinamidine (FGAM) synthase-like amidotransferase family enzyme
VTGRKPVQLFQDILQYLTVESTSDELHVPDVVLDHNLSERFECRFSTVRIERSPSIMLQGMEGCVLGVWVAHGEGL